MAKHLVIVESPAKAKTINKFLGKDYIVEASMGHIRDLPEHKFGVDIKKSFAPEYTLIKGRKKVVDTLKKAAKGVDDIYLAPDPDREGEAIAWHLKALLQGIVPEECFYRVTYNEITAPAIQAAFSSPSTINQHKVDAQQARRVLDRLVGYQVSPLLWRTIRGGSSAGRVQSVALRLVCEREEEIEKFVPEEYWLIGASVRKLVDPLTPFSIKLTRIDGEKADIKNQEQAEAVQQDLNRRDLIVANITEKQMTKRPRPPFITSSLQQSASSLLGFTPSRTMRIAQTLYEGVDLSGQGETSGLITYMRTDSFNISQQALSSCRDLIASRFGEEYLPEKPNFYKSRGSAQEAHEAIRPTDVRCTPDDLKSVLKADEFKLYRIIWERFVACQMTPAKIKQCMVEIEAGPNPEKDDAPAYQFRASASEVVFPGYMKVTGVEKDKSADEKGESDDVDALPPLTKDEALHLLEWSSDQKFTQPPKRFSEASLVRMLEENGVGRPSTYAQTIQTLYSRDYIIKEKRTVKPTELGRNVNGFLIDKLRQLFEVDFTAKMEDSLDAVEKGEEEWASMIGKFYDSFKDWVEEAKGPKAEMDEVNRVLDLLVGVKEWAPEVKHGKRKYNDKKFVDSLRKQIEKNEKAVSQRQADTLKMIAGRYLEQVPALAAAAEELGIQPPEENGNHEPPREETLKKLALLENVTFKEPRKVGRITYDDKAFSGSLRDQVQSGSCLSENQVRYLNRLVLKYSDQIENLDAMADELGLNNEEDEKDEVSGPLLEALKNVETWRDPVTRGKRTWDDKEFYQSLTGQFREKKKLSPKQIKTLKTMVKRYSEQIPDYEKLQEQFELGAKKK